MKTHGRKWRYEDRYTQKGAAKDYESRPNYWGFIGHRKRMR